MKVNAEHIARHSEEEYAHRLRILSDAGAGIIHVRTKEIVRATMTTRKVVLLGDNEYNEWDIVNGMAKYKLDNMTKTAKGNNCDEMTAIADPMKHVGVNSTLDNFLYYCYVNPQYWLGDNPPITHFLEKYSNVLPPSRVRIILITPDEPLPEALSDLIVTLPFDPPAHSELKDYLSDIVEGVEGAEDIIDLEDEDYDQICFAAAGLSKASFEMHASLSIVEAAHAQEDYIIGVDDIVDGINIGKTEIVNKNDILELYQPEDMKDVGGMDKLKEWVSKRKDCYSDEAEAFGVEAPKGLVFVGIPGTGKSLASKAISKEFGVPLIRLDFSKVFNSFIGKSEERMRTALNMIEAMSPCVVLADELDKGLGGIGSGGGDSGTSSRVLGSFLTWLQENKSPVFTVVTANNITGLPPELLRRGRFDAIFGATMPKNKERREVLAIHLGKRGYNIDNFKEQHVKQVITKSRGYVPAEIESAVKDALIDAFSAGEEMAMKHVYNALENMVPMSRTYAEQIQTMTVWIEGNATPASSEKEETDDGKVSNIKSRRTRVPTKKD